MSDAKSDDGKMRNVGGKSAAWLRQVGIRTLPELQQHGAIGAFLKVKKAGFKPSLNLLYALAGALEDCHWQQLGAEKREALVAELHATEESLGIAGKPKWGGPPRPVTTIAGEDYDGPPPEEDEPSPLRFDD
ncbi:MAG: TfoX/Sxy family protein [Pseudoxanthomonas sp.]|nr:TfoX/Sxy family protein [Pseudoxanthomonas sp.]